MPRRAGRARLGALLAGLAVALLGAQSASADDPTIYVHYTMNCTFSIVGDNGAPIGVIPPGRYQVLVTSPVPFAEPDLSGVSDPNLACGHSLSFRLNGPGVNLHTTLEDGDGSADQMQATFEVGTYVAQEDRRAALTRTVITVSSGAAGTGIGAGGATGGGSGGSGGGGSGSSSGTKPLQPSLGPGGPFRGWLNGNVDVGGKPTLRFKGRKFSSLKSGRYTIAVVDETSKRGFTLQRVGRAAIKLTPLTFVGRRTRTVTLGEGRWTFYSAPATKRYFTVTR
jgi:hypothetical protein